MASDTQYRWCHVATDVRCEYKLLRSRRVAVRAHHTHCDRGEQGAHARAEDRYGCGGKFCAPLDRRKGSTSTGTTGSSTHSHYHILIGLYLQLVFTQVITNTDEQSENEQDDDDEQDADEPPTASTTQVGKRKRAANSKKPALKKSRRGSNKVVDVVKVTDLKHLAKLKVSGGGVNCQYATNVPDQSCRCTQRDCVAPCSARQCNRWF